MNDDRSQRLAGIPVNQHLGFELRRSSSDGAELAMKVQKWFQQEGGVVHGGLITALADTCAVYAFHPFLEPGQTMTSIELKINFLRPGRLEGGELLARSSVVRRGKTIGLCEVDVFQDDQLIAKGLLTY